MAEIVLRTGGLTFLSLSLIIPDRQAETAAQWMRQQPDLAVVSRDRGSEYASAAREGAPQAIQCADRFHVVKNLTEAVQVLRVA